MSPDLMPVTGRAVGVSRLDGLCIHEAFSLQAAKSPQKIALTCGDVQLSYADLNLRANQLAHFLKKRGAGPEVPVALYLERSIEMVVAILAVLKTGAAYVPIDLAYPAERVAFMLSDSGAPLLITHSSLLAKLPPAENQVLCLNELDLEAEPGTDPEIEVSRENMAYIIYTSGSTGKPKGVVVTQNNVLRLFSSTECWYQFADTDVWPLFHSYSFDMSVWELWGALLYGGRLVVVPYLASRTPTEFYALLSREKVTFLNQTPSAFRQLIWADANAQEKLPLALRFVTLGGEALELQTLRPWFAIHGDQTPTVVNKYGITETTVHTTYRPIRHKDLDENLGSVIGVPIPDLTVHLLDEKLHPVVKGNVGEICVGGEGVARGYLNRPELNAARFIRDPFSSKDGATLYRSGDLARINERGEMEYLGRMDHQVKIRGFRIELGEIESALNRHEAVRESVVLATGDEGEKRLVAYFVPVEATPTVTELRTHLQKFLPDYMVPAFFISLPSFPLTNNGKIDRRALPAPESSRPALGSTYEGPSTEAEKALVEIWQDVLQVDQVGVNDNLFELGGDSIRSIGILARAQQRGLHLSLAQMFQNPTIRALAKCATAEPCEQEREASTPFSLISDEDRLLLPGDVVDAYPIARLQLGMFFRNDLDPVSAMYHDIFSYRVESRFEEPALLESLRRLVQRHPILRTSFHIADFSEPLQLVHASAKPVLTIDDLQHLDSQAQQAALVAWVEAEKRKPFNRLEPPLARWHVLRLGENCFQLILSFHHVCLDGWSLAAVITEVLADYHALLLGRSTEMAAPAASYREFVRLEREAMQSPDCRAFWQTRLQDAPFHQLPRWPKEMCAGGHEQVRGPEIVVEAPVFDGLKRVAQKAGVPLKTVLFAAHIRVMSALQGQPDLTTGLLCNGRPEQADGEKLLGLFLNTLPVRVQVCDGTWLDLVRQTFEAEREIIPHRRYPLVEIQRLLGGRPAFEAAFDFVHFHVYRDLQGCQGLSLTEGHYFEANDLPAFTTFILDVTSTQLQLHMDYDPNLLCREQIEQISWYYIAALRALAANPEGRHEHFSPLSPEESKCLLQDFNQTEEAYPKNASVHELVAAQVALRPNQTAVSAASGDLSYRELHELSDRLAARLVQLKVGREMPVAICLERTPRLLIGLLGILKAGAAYVPLDPAFPSERLRFMLEDTAARVIVTETSLLPVLPPTDAEIICLDSPDVFAGVIEPVSLTPVPAEDLAYVIYTSGSTGKPKGVQITHRSVVNLLLSAARTAGISEKDRLLAVTTLSFDIAGLELFMPLVLGGTVILADRETASDARQLAGLIQASGASLMQATPATWRMLIEAGWNGSPNLKVFSGGEALSRRLADQLLERTAEVWNFYGPTETTIWSTAARVERDKDITIGRPLANTQVYILDSRMRIAPLGAVGELHIGGAGLARGYWNRPDLTHSRFVANPFSADPEDRLYKTGDLARFLPDGTIECLGRMDHQVKIRGFRIELGEVETVLRQYPSVANALVTASENSFGEKRLVGYLTSKNSPPSTADLRGFMQSKLPAYMIPSHFVLLDAFPLTPNGKVDLKQLPPPEGAMADRPYEAPRNADEEKLASIWCHALGVSRIGIQDNVFDFGCDSLSATRAFARINQDFCSEIRLKDIFEHPTIADLVQVVKARRGSAVFNTPILPRRTRRVAPRA